MTTQRLQLPTLFDGDWDSALIVTYGADLEFYERDLLRQLARARNRIVLADARQVSRKLADPLVREQLRQVNRTYVLAPLRVERAAHAKLILLLTEDRGLLAVGSGNLGMNGYASQGECFTTHRWTHEEPDSITEFLAARSFLDELGTLGLVDEVIQTRMKQAWANAPWLYGSPGAESPRVRSNLTVSFLDQFVDAIGRMAVDELVIHAPFYDHGCRALAELIRRTSPAKVQILLQERLTSVDPDRLAATLSNASAEVEVRSVQAEEKGTFLHAKFLIARSGQGAVCLQGSPNISSPALLDAYPAGNIELANVLTGDRRAFDHLVHDLVLSGGNVEISALGLKLADDADDDDEVAAPMGPTGLTWISPNLSGTFDGEIRVAPKLLIDESVVDDVAWSLEEPADGGTSFVARLGEEPAVMLDRVSSVSFDFGDGTPSGPSFPYHLRTLTALASGQGRTDLLKQAGDFDLDDEELEELLAQLDEVLVVDGRSIWRMLKREEPANDDEGSSSLAYEDLDWAAIQAHPKLAQYRNWATQSGSEPTALGILLNSITERFEADLERRRSGAPPASADDLDPLSDLGSTIDPEDEEEAEQQEEARERRRITARARARRQFHGFIDRFVQGLTDEDFVRNVGPSVIVPSYVVFNHLCWKLIQVELVDPMRVIRAQTQLWTFVWGDRDRPGYLSEMSVDEQESALEILERHHSESVLLCALHQAYDYAWHEDDEPALVEIRDTWRTILLHDLWQPSSASVTDSATLLEPVCESAGALVEELDGLASYVQDREPLLVAAAALGIRPEEVSIGSGRVNRGDLGPLDVPIFVVEASSAVLTLDSARAVLNELHSLLPDVEYIRVEDRRGDALAFADFETGDHVFADRATGDVEDLPEPVTTAPAWAAAVESLYEMAGMDFAA